MRGGSSELDSRCQSKASRSALGRARRALAPRPALRATVARRLRSGRARPAVTRRPSREQPQQRRSVPPHFDPFGTRVEPTSPELTRIGFTGQDHDDDLGLIDMKGRVYDPLAGRFQTADPVMQGPFWSQGLNRYSYVFNNPVNNTDPSGFRRARW